jgi:hypothetical protein
MTRTFLFIHGLAAAAALSLAAGCSSSAPSSPTAASPVPSAGATGATSTGGSATTLASHSPVAASGIATGERTVGNQSIEPAYNADSGELMFLLTPEGAPLPSKANGHATSPLYLVEYPIGSTAAGSGAYNCAGVPGNCPDHDANVANAAAGIMPAVYGHGVLGHDHIADPPGKPDFNVAWEVWEVLFTEQGVSDHAVNRRLTTDGAIAKAIAAGDAIKVDLGFAFNCSVVPESLYWKGTPVG